MKSRMALCSLFVSALFIVTVLAQEPKNDLFTRGGGEAIKPTHVDVTNSSDLGLVVHHPKLGIALKEQMDKLGIECIVQYRAAEGNKTERHGGGNPIGTVEFVKKHFAAAKK